MYIGCSFTFFFLSQWNTGQKYNTAQGWKYCTCLDIWTDEKVNYFGYCYLFLFLHGPFLGIHFQMDMLDCFLVLCSNVVWNPFLMKTTFTSDFSWFQSVFVNIWEHLCSISIFTFVRCIESCFFCTATCWNQSPQSLFSGHRVIEMNISTESDSTWKLVTNSSKNRKWKKWAIIQEQKEKCLQTCYA